MSAPKGREPVLLAYLFFPFVLKTQTCCPLLEALAIIRPRLVGLEFHDDSFFVRREITLNKRQGPRTTKHWLQRGELQGELLVPAG